jgi:L-rhamnose mutarotase
MNDNGQKQFGYYATREKVDFYGWVQATDFDGAIAALKKRHVGAEIQSVFRDIAKESKSNSPTKIQPSRPDGSSTIAPSSSTK